MARGECGLTEQRRAAQAEQAAWERQMRAQTESRLAAEAEQARFEAARNVPEPGHGLGSHHTNNHMRQETPAAGITSSPISPFIGPMRPLGR